ncbi:MAG: hypothetical protein ACRELG_11125 [Gemmataceae bacterium]
MSVLVVCACGHRWMSEDDLSATCPACGRALAPIAAGAESAGRRDEMQLFQLRILDRNPLEP